ncbi:MAG: NAD(P)H-hydrate dehydratase [Candidatus Bathyarchaeota archaeon]|nr:MAG: NAD(P)H-hydrate dehydratase [Candidatus Bathyarchaeota archaeon]
METNAEYFGISRLQLMENAGRGVASEISLRFPSKKTRISLFCGLGGNGGDGFVTARHLLSRGYQVDVIVSGKPATITHEATLKNWLSLQQLKRNFNLIEVSDSSQIPKTKADVIIDALLGIGLKGAPKPPILQLIRTINKTRAFCLAVDVPTGLDSDSGEILNEAIRADLTITFHKAKPGLLKAKDNVGELFVADIGLPKILEKYAGPGDVDLIITPRPLESHKGDFGSVLIVGGSETFTGAPALTALAALRAGADLTYIAAPEKTAYALSSISPNLITIKLKGSHLIANDIPLIKQCLNKATAIVIGPGLGLHSETEQAVQELLVALKEVKTSLLLDADGLKIYGRLKQPLDIPLVLTPHTQEFSILIGKKAPSDLKEKEAMVKRTAARFKAVIVLKGNTDIISDGSRIKLNFTGNPGMTVGGTGDILSGVIAALLAQQIDPFRAAVAGTFVNGAAGDFAKKRKGHHLLATDLLDWIPQVLDNPSSHLSVQDNAP